MQSPRILQRLFWRILWTLAVRVMSIWLTAPTA
jgi:hypothetical protein